MSNRFFEGPKWIFAILFKLNSSGIPFEGMFKLVLNVPQYALYSIFFGEGALPDFDHDVLRKVTGFLEVVAMFISCLSEVLEHGFVF